MVTVFADIVCPFTHVGLRRLTERRDELGSTRPMLMNAWPLEWVNGEPLAPAKAQEEIEALRAAVAPDLFVGFDPATFPRTSVPALALASLAYTQDLTTGEAVSLAVRHALFEDGLDVSDPEVLSKIAAAHDLVARDADPEAVRAEYEEGQRRGVVGSPYFIVDGQGYFCPSLDIEHTDAGFSVRFDPEEFEALAQRAFGPIRSVDGGSEPPRA